MDRTGSDKMTTQTEYIQDYQAGDKVILEDGRYVEVIDFFEENLVEIWDYERTEESEMINQDKILGMPLGSVVLMSLYHA